MTLKELKAENGLKVRVSEQVRSNEEYFSLVRLATYCYTAFGLRNGVPVVYFGTDARHEEFLEVIQKEGVITPLWYGQLAGDVGVHQKFYGFMLHNPSGTEGTDDRFRTLLLNVFNHINSRFLSDIINIQIGIGGKRYVLGHWDKSDNKIWKKIEATNFPGTSV
jgi:hypothetical protein